MPFVFKRLALFLSIAAASTGLKGAKEDLRFTPGPAASYESHQTNDKVTIGVVAYVSDEESKPVFGKHNPYNYGILPVLVVIQNDSGKAIRVDGLQAFVVSPDGDRIEATQAKDIRYLSGARPPNVGPRVPSPLPKLSGKKNPLDSWAIEGRAFSAKMLPAGQSASGFFYFQSGFAHGWNFYLSGLTEAETGQALLYFELPLTKK
jgi:hypothetical protein